MRRIVREQNQTLVMVTHDNYIAGFADRQFHIVDGKIFKIEEGCRADLEEVEDSAELLRETRADEAWTVSEEGKETRKPEQEGNGNEG